MDQEIDIVAELSNTDCRAMLRQVLGDLSRLTAAIKAMFPLIMGKGDGAVDTAIALIRRCARAEAEATGTKLKEAFMTPSEKLVWSATFAKVYTDSYGGDDHAVATSKAVRAAFYAVDALRVASTLINMNHRAYDEEVKKIAAEYTQLGKVVTIGKHIQVPDAAQAMYTAFLKED